MKRNENDRRGWIIVALSLLIGLLCVIVAGNMAIRFEPSWSLKADMRSRLNPDVIYQTPYAEIAFQPVDPAILTPPVWLNIFLTPGQIFPTRQPNPTATPVNPTSTQPAATIAATKTASPTSTIFYFPPTAAPGSTKTPVSTQKPATSTSTQATGLIPPGSTSTPTRTSTPTQTSTSTSTPTATATATSTGTATSTATATATSTATSTPTATSTSTNTPVPQADLAVTISDGVVVYSPGSSLTYTVIVSNNGPSNVTGAQVANTIPPQIASWSWACTSQNNGATGCDPVGGTAASFADTVNLPAGASIVYTVTANISGGAAGNLNNTVTITPPVTVLDPATGNNSATDTNDQLNPPGYGNIGSTPDYISNLIPAGTSVTFAFNTPLVVNGSKAWDLAVYEYPNGTGIAMDVMIFQISDGTNWYTVFNWGNGAADTNSNLNINDPAVGGNEIDNRDFSYIPASDILYPFNSGTTANPATGIVLKVPNGTYPYFRIVSPVTGDVDGGCEIDAVAILP